MTAHSPSSLAARWGCSERHVRNLIERGSLKAFRLGKLYRITLEAVGEVERCQNGQSDDSGENYVSSSTETDNGSVTRLGPLTRARLTGLRQRSTQS